ncbi:hypothetical protein D9M68_134560 [compost metagenome]
MPNPLRQHRLAAYLSQSGRCFYCGAAMWLAGVEGFARKYGMSVGRAWFFRCTAEHLLARSEGGGDGQENIVAACCYCNRKRHERKRPMPPESYRRHVLGRLQRGRWHQAWVFRCADGLLPARTPAKMFPKGDQVHVFAQKQKEPNDESTSLFS